MSTFATVPDPLKCNRVIQMQKPKTSRWQGGCMECCTRQHSMPLIARLSRHQLPPNLQREMPGTVRNSESSMPPVFQCNDRVAVCFGLLSSRPKHSQYLSSHYQPATNPTQTINHYFIQIYGARLKHRSSPSKVDCRSFTKRATLQENNYGFIYICYGTPAPWQWCDELLSRWILLLISVGSWFPFTVGPSATLVGPESVALYVSSAAWHASSVGPSSVPSGSCVESH